LVTVAFSGAANTTLCARSCQTYACASFLDFVFWVFLFFFCFVFVCFLRLFFSQRNWDSYRVRVLERLLHFRCHVGCLM
jgi:hypothetical protein